jgi:hypothetical protein
MEFERGQNMPPRRTVAGAGGTGEAEAKESMIQAHYFSLRTHTAIGIVDRHCTVSPSPKCDVLIPHEGIYASE